MVKIYHKGKVLFCMPESSTVKQISAAARIMADKLKLNHLGSFYLKGGMGLEMQTI